MYELLLRLLMYFLLMNVLGSSSIAYKTNKHKSSNPRNTTHDRIHNMHGLFSDPSDIETLGSNQTSTDSTGRLRDRDWFNVSTDAQEYTEWTPWSRCMDCFQRRMKTCIAARCEGSRMYEERPCNRKRCKRKARLREEFHVVHMNESSSYLTKQAPSEIWSRWSQWTPCTPNCRTYRIRKCRKPGRCSKQVQKEEAFCYHEGSKCEVYVLNLIEKNKYNDDGKWYQYSNNNQETAVRQPKNNKRCGLPHRRSRMLKIIGGTEAKKYKWPWHVAILNQHMEVFCGGTLIASRWVLTASHCIRKYLRVRLNAHDLRSTDGSDIELTVYKMFPHPKFDFKTVDNDIALLMLPKAVKIPVACLPNKRPKPKQLCSVMGWGKVDPDDIYGIAILHEAKLPIVQSKTCRKSYKQFYISSNMLCAGWASGMADTCAGDSGGGLMCPTKHYKKTVYSVQGITSFGDGCGRKNKYGIYTTVFNYIGWINHIIDHYS